MHRIIIAVSAIFLPLIAHAEDASATRRDGFLRIWESIQRPAFPAKTAFADVPETARGSLEIDYAVSRGIIDDGDLFHPDAPLSMADAQLWLIRTRNIEPRNASGATLLMQIADPEHTPALAALYGIDTLPPDRFLSDAELTAMIESLDAKLQEEEHEVSLYAEQFHGDGTAFGETFDMHAFTAAHRSLPHNTLVRVTNVANGKSVIVRINDRGPFVQGRDMDLSLAAFTSIEDRSKGKFMATFERLGSADVIGAPLGPVQGAVAAVRSADRTEEDAATGAPDARIDASCLPLADRFMQRIGRFVLGGGVPHQLAFGTSLHISGPEAFVVRSFTDPNGIVQRVENWIVPGEEYVMKPSVEGVYGIRLETSDGRGRTMETLVRRCGV